MDPTIQALFLFADHYKRYASECMYLVHHIQCGSTALFKEKAKIFIRNHIYEDFDMPDDTRTRIISLLDAC